MRLSPAMRIGSYEVTGLLGAGGMGEVYRARDSRLNRDVAIKVLPPTLAPDPDRVARFEREAQLLAALNHPHIAHVFELLDIPTEGGGTALALVLELVQGGTLADRVTGGPLPVRDALRIARDIADGLQAAHDSGIIHRDLKPANVALTPAGKPKILDFGLAKAFTSSSDATTLVGATGAGVVLGTAPYMSPEQTRGLPLDKRSDIWSFGCVLYEMLTGSHPFTGLSASDIIVAILERDPDLDALPATTPARVRWLLRRCLEKDPTNRLHDIADARIELDEALRNPEATSGESPAVGMPATRHFVTRERAAWLTAGVALTALVVALMYGRGRALDPPPGTVYRSAILLPEELRLLALEPASRFALSPDGRRLALIASSATGVPTLWIRPLDSLVAQPIAGTEGASYPFWSPDSKSVAFLARPADQPLVGMQAKLARVDLAGGQPVNLADVTFSATGAWSRDNVILFTKSGTSPLFRVSATAGGVAVPVGKLDTESGDVQHSYPAFLPDGRHYLYTAVGSRAGANNPRAVYVASLDGREPARQILDAGSNARYANGHLVFLREGTLLAQRLDMTSLTLQGEAVPIADRVQVTSTGSSGGPGAFSISDTGLLVYQTGLQVRSQLAWMDRAGRPMGLVGQPADYAEVALSPDGSRAIVSAMDPQLGTRDLWIIDVARGSRERFTSEPSDDYAPVWSPRGDRIAFTSVRQGSTDIYERNASGSGPERGHNAARSALGKFAASWSPDGGSLLYIAGGRALARSDLHVMRMDADGPPTPYRESPFIETQARFSPDGRSVAYVASDSGNLEVYVSPFPGPADRQRVSNSGGAWPRWRKDGREIFFLSPDATTMFSAPVSTQGASLRIGDPQPLFKVRLRPLGRLDAYPYDVAADGRFLLNSFVGDTTSTSLTLVVNWPAALR